MTEQAPSGRDTHPSIRPPGIQDGRGQPNPYSTLEQVKRSLWHLIYWPLFRCVPRFVSGWHRSVLRAFGATIGKGVIIRPSAIFECPWNVSLGDYSVVGAEVRLYALGPIHIGDHTVLSQRAHLCAGTHDYTDSRMPLIRAPVVVGKGAWICTEAFLGPHAVVGNRTVVGARSVVIGTLPDDMVCAGNPCKPIKPRRMR